MSSFDRFLTRVLNRTGQEASEYGSATMEAHHLLLAIAAEPEPTTHQVLTAVGLDYPAVRAALDREFGQSLAAAGVSFAGAPVAGGSVAGASVAGASVAGGVPRPSSARKGAPPPGASLKLAMERGLGSAARKRDLRPAHLLLGIVQAQAGTVPRALALAGVDQTDLTERIRQTLTNDGN